MSEKPHEKILHRELHVHDAKVHYSDQDATLVDIVNYGTNLVPSCLASSPGQLADIVVVTVLLKQVVLMLDAFQVLTANACSDAAQLQARSLFEASIYIDWMLLGETEKKARYYYVSNVRREREWALRTIPEKSEHRKFFDGLGEFGESLEEARKENEADATARLAEIDGFLSKEPFASVSADFEKSRGSRNHDPVWHAPLGESSVRALAKAVDRLPEYEIFYGQTSETSHASRHTAHVKIRKGEIIMEPIRHLEGLKATMHFAISATLHTYRRVLEAYRPGQLPEFCRRYIEDWRGAIMNIKNITYSSE